MAIASQVANAARFFRMNQKLMEKCCTQLTVEEWYKQPNGDANHMLWVAGHILWARAAVLRFTGGPEWTRPWLTEFARGKELQDASVYPAPEEVMNSMAELAATVQEALENAPEETLIEAAPPNSPPGDGTKAGVVNFLAFHETYHVGQMAYLCGWLGHGGPQG